VSGANEGTRELALSEDERANERERVSRLGRFEGCAGRCSHKVPTIELLLLFAVETPKPQTAFATETPSPTPTAPAKKPTADYAVITFESRSRG
jgi:hypothetical protein